MEILPTRIQLQELMNMDTIMYSPRGFEDEDDAAFYDELRRQVLQLTEEDDAGFYNNKNRNVVVGRGRNGLNSGPQDKGYYDWPVNKEESATPPWMANLWRSAAGNGTGVFIPQQIVQTKRKYRSRRKNQGRTYKRVEKMNS